MVQSPSSEANSHSASQEILCHLQNPKVHYRVHNSHPLVSILSHMHPVHTFSFCFLKIHSNIIHLASEEGLCAIELVSSCGLTVCYLMMLHQLHQFF